MIIYLNGVQVHPRQDFINDAHVLGESVEDAARRVGVEESHRSSQDITEHLIVQLDGTAHAHPEEQDGSEIIMIVKSKVWMKVWMKVTQHLIVLF